MSEKNDNTDWAGQIIGAVFQWGFLILAGAWIICQWLTRLLFEFVLNPLLDGALDRHDGLVVLLSAGLWAGVALLCFPVLIAPQLEGASTEELGQALLAALAVGLAWGLSIGFWILLSWWNAAERLEPAYQPAQLLGEPIPVLPPPSDKGETPLPSKEELQAELDEIFSRKLEKERV